MIDVTPSPNMFHATALVIGSGISGLFTAIKLSEAGVSVILVTKSSLMENNSRYAQGGIAAVLPENPEDSIELHVADTIKASAGLCDETVVRSILSEGYEAIMDLIAHGVHFDKTSDEQIALTREAAHSVNRILHAAGDATGYSVEMSLINRVIADPNIKTIDYAHGVELLKDENNRCLGCRCVLLKPEKELAIYARFTVLATGGVGRLYSHTTNPAIATGDGVALAHLAGATIENMEFVQFHPTAFYFDGEQHFLISEALRGEGGILRDHDGAPFAGRFHPDGELAPRDIVTRGIYDEIQRSGVPYVYLDITHLPTEKIETRFPTILKNCLTFGVDIRKDWIPVSPAAHYMMGGVAVDAEGKSTVEGLYVVGETASSGLHGANRLASNSLLECVVLARRVSRHIAGKITTSVMDTLMPLAPVPATRFAFAGRDGIRRAMATLQELMWRHVGILRDEAGLKEALDALNRMEAEAVENQWSRIMPDGNELLTQVRVGKLVTKAALARRESRGAHYRTDYPESRPEYEHASRRVMSCRS